MRAICILIVGVLALTACSTDKPPRIPSAKELAKAFFTTTGYAVNYDIHFVSDSTSWDIDESIPLSYNETLSAYETPPLHIDPHRLSNNRMTFKLTSKNWVHQFGFVDKNSTIEESLIAVGDKPVAFDVHHFSTHSMDMQLAIPERLHSRRLKIYLKVTESQLAPDGLIYIAMEE